MNKNIERIKQLHESLFIDINASKIIDVLPICIHEISVDGKITKMNEAGLCMLNLPEEEVVNSDYLSYVCEKDLPEIKSYLNDALTNGTTKTFDFTSVNGDLYTSCFAPLIVDDKVTKIVGYTQELNKK